MKPHLWLSILHNMRGQWACCTASALGPYTKYGRVIRPVWNDDIFYGATPQAAYQRWREANVDRY